MRRRFNLLPFTVTIPAAGRDAELSEKLHLEWSGILQWMVDGCLAWQREGLNPPAVVAQATEDYLASEDTLGQWLEEFCSQGPGFSSSTSALYESYQEWCKKNGEQVCSKKRFSQNLEARQFKRERSAVIRGFSGLGLKSDICTASTIVADSRTLVPPTAHDLGFP